MCVHHIFIQKSAAPAKNFERKLKCQSLILARQKSNEKSMRMIQQPFEKSEYDQAKKNDLGTLLSVSILAPAAA